MIYFIIPFIPFIAFFIWVKYIKFALGEYDWSQFDTWKFTHNELVDFALCKGGHRIFVHCTVAVLFSSRAKIHIVATGEYDFLREMNKRATRSFAIYVLLKESQYQHACKIK